MNAQRISFIFLCTASLVGGCATKNSQQQVSPPPGFDPDAPALPAEATKNESAEKPAATATLPPSNNTFKEESLQPASEKAPVPVTTSQEQRSVPATNVPATPDTHKTVGSGPTIRYVSATYMHIRSKPDRFSTSLGELHMGDEVHVTLRGGWAKLDEGKWIRSRWLTKSPPKASDSNSAVDEDPAPKKVKSKKRRHHKSH